MNHLLKTQLVHVSKPRTSTEGGPAGGLCRYSYRECMQNSVEGYNFCLRHILEDKTAPFKQCSYITKSGRRCSIAALKLERKDGLCMDHAKKATLSKQRMNRRKRPRESADALLEDLAHCSGAGMDDQGYQWGDQHRRSRASCDSLASKSLEPLVDATLHQCQQRVADEYARSSDLEDETITKVQREYGSSSDSEAETQTVEQTWRDDGDSDADSIDSDQEDMLKYAGVYTTEEVAQVLRDKLIRLQALYIDQFKRLKHVLLSKRRQYLASYKAERESLGSIKLYKKDPSQKPKYDKLCAMKRYHRKFGKESLLQKQSTERRKKTTLGLDYTPPGFPKCVFTDDDLQCGVKVVPLSKFCPKHILHDPHQVLYRPCPFADSQCGRPVPSLLPVDQCSLHQKLQAVKDDEAYPMEVKQELEVKHEPGLSFANNQSGPSSRHHSQSQRSTHFSRQTETHHNFKIDIKTEAESSYDVDMTVDNQGAEFADLDVEETVDIEGHDTSGGGEEGMGLFTVDEMEEDVLAR